MNFKPAEGVCYRPDLYDKGACEKCKYKNYAKCPHNGYTKFKIPKEGITEESLPKKEKKKRGRKKKVS